MDIEDYIYNPDGSVTIVYADGTSKTVMPSGGTGNTSTGSTNTGSTTSSGGTGWLGGVLSAVPGILSALFPNGIGGGGGNNNGTIYTNPTTGTTAVNLAGSGTNPILLIALALMAGYFLFSGQKIKGKK
jgi:hypothetical protein